MSLIKYNQGDKSFYVHSVNDYAHLEELME
jgi:hypothetical protein